MSTAPDVVAVEWDQEAYTDGLMLSYDRPSGARVAVPLAEVGLKIDRSAQTKDSVHVVVGVANAARSIGNIQVRLSVKPQ